jgi:hypothetical protein
MKTSYFIKRTQEFTHNVRILIWKLYSTPSSFVSLHIMVSFIHESIIVATLVHYGVGPLLICGYNCMAAQSNTQVATSACMCHSDATSKSCDVESTSLFTVIVCAGE